MLGGFHAVRPGRPVRVEVSGPAGVGKSALTQRFVTELREAPQLDGTSTAWHTGRIFAHIAFLAGRVDAAAEVLEAALKDPTKKRAR